MMNIAEGGASHLFFCIDNHEEILWSDEEDEEDVDEHEDENENWEISSYGSLYIRMFHCHQ
mgnify:FL=1